MAHTSARHRTAPWRCVLASLALATATVPWSVAGVPPNAPAPPPRPALRPDAPRPNIIVVVADDLGFGDLGAYGGSAIATPNIDSLARDGLRMTDFHASDSVCTPSRAGLLTGRYARRMRLDVPLLPLDMDWQEWLVARAGFAAGSVGLMDLATEAGAGSLDADEITIAEALREGGYDTAMVGKWHLGDYATDAAYDPRRHGFDHYLGVPYSNDMTPFPLLRDGEVLEAEVVDQGTLTRRYTEEAVAFIEAERDKPFFLYFAHTFPHRPLHRSEDFVDRSKAGLYGDVVEELDWSMGQVLAALERRGIARDTLMVFTSDNGPWYQGSPGGLRGRKGQSFEGGHRVPMLVRWPGHIPAGSVSAAPTMNIDIFPTALAVAGVEPPTNRTIDGRSLERLLANPSMPGPHEALFFYHQGQLEAVREGNWKYFRSVNHYVWPMPVNEALGFISPHTNGPLPLLFDLSVDRDESYDVSGRYPDVAARLATRIARFEEELAANRKGWK